MLSVVQEEEDDGWTPECGGSSGTEATAFTGDARFREPFLTDVPTVVSVDDESSPENAGFSSGFILDLLTGRAAFTTAGTCFC